MIVTESLPQTPPTDESALVQAAQQHPDGFRPLYQRYFPRVFAYVAYRVGQQQDVEDVVSNIFVKVVEHLPRFEERGAGSFAAWLFRIALNEVHDFYRRQKRSAWLSLDDLPDLIAPHLPLDDHLQRQERFARLYRLLAELTPRRREIISLRFFAELRNQEIASVLGLDERTVASHLCRGLEDLQQKYQLEESSHE
jgi:RNA polymerase sigma-70 factor (ECF subfamily)